MRPIFPHWEGVGWDQKPLSNAERRGTVRKPYTNVFHIMHCELEKAGWVLTMVPSVLSHHSVGRGDVPHGNRNPATQTGVREGAGDREREPLSSSALSAVGGTDFAIKASSSLDWKANCYQPEKLRWWARDSLTNSELEKHLIHCQKLLCSRSKLSPVLCPGESQHLDL